MVDSELSELVHLHVVDHVATITLDSPHNRNALSQRLTTELLSHLLASDRRDDVRVVLLKASGRVFCSGADLAEAATTPMEDSARAIVALQRTIAAMSKPVVAAVQGSVRAGGIGLVAAADIAVVATEATFALTEVKFGLAPAVISMTVLPRLSQRAAGITALGGAVFNGVQAAEYGLVTMAAPSEKLDALVAEIVGNLRAGSPQGMRETKALLNADLLARIDADGERLVALSARLFGSPVARTTMKAFLASRSPSRPRSG